MRAIPVMLALLLALSPVAVAIQTPAATAESPSPSHEVAVQSGESPAPSDGSTVRTGQSSSDGNTTTVMTLGDDPARTAFTEPSLSLGSALATDYDGLRTRLSVDTLDERLRNAGSIEKRRQILNRYRYRTENRIISLKARERQATLAFTNGTLSDGEYLRTLGRIHSQVADIREMINAIEQRAGRTGYRFDARSARTKLVMLDGPVRSHVVETMRNGVASNQVFVAASERGVVLSTIRNGQYVREVYRADNRNSSSTGQMSFEEAESEVVRPQFPWVMDIDNINGARQRQYSSISALRFIYFHRHGTLTAYVDTSTERIYRTVQRKQLVGENTLPPGPAVRNSSANLTLAVNRTYPGGPLRVRLTNATGAPVQAEVSVGGETVGRTSDDGVLWTLGPTETFEVSATYDGRTVNVTATPVDHATPENVTVEPVNVSSRPVPAS